MKQMVVMASKHHPPKVSTTMGRKPTLANRQAGRLEDNFHWMPKGGISFLGDEEEGVGSIEVEFYRGAISLNYVERSYQVPRGIHQGPIVEVPCVQALYAQQLDEA